MTKVADSGLSWSMLGNKQYVISLTGFLEISLGQYRMVHTY